MKYIITFELQVAIRHAEGTDYRYDHGKYEYDNIEDAKEVFEDMQRDSEYFNIMRNF